MHLHPGPLENRWVALTPFSPEVREAVRAATNVDPDAWAQMASDAHGAGFDAWWEAAEARTRTGACPTYAVTRRSDGRTVGMTGFKSPDAAGARVEIGATFLHPDARGGPVNPAAKRLMLAHAFQGGARRVEIRTDAANLRSQAAIAKLGAVREGVLRRYRATASGQVRDTVLYAVTDLDWPAVRAGLDARLAAFGSP